MSHSHPALISAVRQDLRQNEFAPASLANILGDAGKDGTQAPVALAYTLASSQGAKQARGHAILKQTTTILHQMSVRGHLDPKHPWPTRRHRSSGQHSALWKNPRICDSDQDTRYLGWHYPTPRANFMQSVQTDSKSPMRRGHIWSYRYRMADAKYVRRLPAWPALPALGRCIWQEG
ncbi:hypothetical protein LZ31DRAFT_350002 [Colletotrichum somersetense]|nr:hypothetical protein LZ31DRAFT_350002 [Colletotrichum somersetense]